MAATQLSLYNDALRNLGSRKLASLSEAREPRYLLDDAWADGAQRYCLEAGLWTFAMRGAKLDYSPSVEPPFGLRYAFDKATDWVRTAAVCSDERYSTPIDGNAFADEAGFIFADLQTIYVKYVSDDASFGFDLSLWPETFTRWVGAYLATQIVNNLTSATVKADQMEKRAHRLLVDARSKDAMNTGTQFLPLGGWARARSGRRSYLDRGNRGQLIG